MLPAFQEEGYNSRLKSILSLFHKINSRQLPIWSLSIERVVDDDCWRKELPDKKCLLVLLCPSSDCLNTSLEISLELRLLNNPERKMSSIPLEWPPMNLRSEFSWNCHWAWFPGHSFLELAPSQEKVPKKAQSTQKDRSRKQVPIWGESS